MADSQQQFSPSKNTAFKNIFELLPDLKFTIKRLYNTCTWCHKMAKLHLFRFGYVLSFVQIKIPPAIPGLKLFFQKKILPACLVEIL